MHALLHRRQRLAPARELLDRGYRSGAAPSTHANRVSDRSFPRSGETVFGLPETEGPELPLKWSFFPAETASRLCAPQNRGVFVKPREISVSVGLHGGACSPLSTGLGSQIP